MVCAWLLPILLTSGCVSLLLGEGPEPHQQTFVFTRWVNQGDEEPVCTESYTLAAIDAALALAWVPIVAIAPDDESGFSPRDASLTLAILIGGLSAFSAGYGVHTVRRCRAAKRRWHATHPAGATS